MFSESLSWGFPVCASTALWARQSCPSTLKLSVTEEERKKQGNHDWNYKSTGLVSRN